MNAYIRGLCTGLVMLAVLGITSGAPIGAQSVTSAQTVDSVRRMLERLPYYGVFDYIVFRVDRGTVYLAGYSFDGRVKTDAETATKRASGVDGVANKIEVLPPSQNDDRIRWETFYRIYTDDFLSRYAPGGVQEVLRELRDERHFPGMQPVGIYPIHIIVKGGRTMLLGVVDSAADRQIAEVRAREVTGVFEVDNSLSIRRGPQHATRPGAQEVPYGSMPAVAPIGVRVDKYLEVPESAKGPTIDRVEGYRTEKLGDGLFMITDGAYQSMFMTYENGVVVVDAPPSYASHIPRAVAEVTDKPITHLVYSHYHVDHIGGATSLGGHPIIIAQKETNRLLARDKDPKRPLASVTFDDQYRLSVGSQVLELSYRGNAHAPGNIFIHAPRQRTLMIVDVVFPGWMPWRRFAVAQDVPEYFAQVQVIKDWDFDTLVGGHVARTGTRADVAVQLAFMEDLKTAAQTALKRTALAAGLNPSDRENPWAVFDHYIDRVAIDCVNQLTPKWSTKLAAFDVYIWDQCFSMEQSLRID